MTDEDLAQSPLCNKMERVIELKMSDTDDVVVCRTSVPSRAFLVCGGRVVLGINVLAVVTISSWSDATE